MGVIGETGYCSNFADGRISRSQLPNGVIDSQSTDIFPERLPEVFTERATQVRRMNADFIGDLNQRQALQEPIVQKVFGLFKPRRGADDLE